MKRFFIFCLFICFITISEVPQLMAETLKIGVFDIKGIIRGSKVIEGYRQKFLKEIESKRRPLGEKEESVKQIEEKLKKEKIYATERKTLDERLANEIKELKRMKEDIDLDLQKMDRELTQRALRDIDKVINDIAKKEGYTIIFEKNAAGIVYFDESVEITQKIISLYDRL